jgi:Raf kinase inhibitor-like YbhB/YbcL family protein
MSRVRLGPGRVRRSLGRAAAAGSTLACLLGLAGCGLLSSGITITAPSVMTVASGAFTRSTMPVRYTCAGRRVLNPPLDWTGAPKGTQSIALVVDDSDAPITPYVYWIVFDIGSGTSAILDGQLPPGARQARGSAGYDRYDPPCPGPRGHSYRFTVYALDKRLKLPNGTSVESAWQAIAAATIGRGRLTVSATS